MLDCDFTCSRSRTQSHMGFRQKPTTLMATNRLEHLSWPSWMEFRDKRPVGKEIWASKEARQPSTVVRKLQGLILKNFKLNSTLNNIFTNKLFSSQKFDFYICSDDDFINGVADLIQRYVMMYELVIFLLHMERLRSWRQFFWVWCIIRRKWLIIRRHVILLRINNTIEVCIISNSGKRST